MAPYDRDSIRTLRESLGLSQRELASHLDVPQTTVNRWETGRTTPNAEYLGMMADLARRHSRTFEPFADATRPRERVDIAAQAALEWLARSRGPRGKARGEWHELFVQMLEIGAKKVKALAPLRARAEAAASAPEAELTALLDEVQRALPRS